MALHLPSEEAIQEYYKTIQSFESSYSLWIQEKKKLKNTKSSEPKQYSPLEVDRHLLFNRLGLQKFLKSIRSDVRVMKFYLLTHPSGDESIQQFVHFYDAVQKENEDSIYHLQKLTSLELNDMMAKKKQRLLKKPPTSKSYLNYRKDLDAQAPYLKSLRDSAASIYHKKKELCDSEGFYQHKGECWSDTVQQVMLNADGIKEYTQPAFIFSNIYSYDLLDETLVPDFNSDKDTYLQINPELIQEQRKWVFIYLREVQLRFLRHYIMEGKRRNLLKEESCSLGAQPGDAAREKIQQISLNSQFRKKGAQGETSAILGKLGKLNKNRIGNLSPSLEAYEAFSIEEHGGTDSDIYILINIFNQLFLQNKMDTEIVFLDIPRSNPLSFYNFLQQKFTDESTIDQYINSCPAVFLSIQIDFLNGNKAGHEAAFYTCGGTQIFYEDNSGIIPFKYKLLLKKYLQLKKEKYYSMISMDFRPFLLKQNEQTLFSSFFFPYIHDSLNDTTLLLIDSEFVQVSSSDFYLAKNSFRIERNGFVYEFPFDFSSSSTLTDFIFLHPPNQESIENKNFAPIPEARIRKPISSLVSYRRNPGGSTRRKHTIRNLRKSRKY